MKKCPECKGTGKMVCPVCHGANKDPRNPAKPCSYCKGTLKVRCTICGGHGQLEDHDNCKL